MAKEKSLKLNVALNLIKQLMNLIFPLITFPYSSRILNPDGIGKVNFALSIISYFSLLASMGIGNYAAREAAKIRDNKIQFSQFVKEILIINFSTTFISYLLFFIALFGVPQFQEYRILLCVCSFTIIFSTLGVEWVYRAREEYVYITIRGIVFQFISLALLFIMVKKPDDYIKYASINVISSVGSNILNFLNLHKYVDFNTKLKKQIKKHFKPVIILFGSAIAARIYTELDKTMLGFLSSSEQVGYYSAATKLTHLVINLLAAVTSVISPRLSNYYEHDKKKYISLLEKTANITLLLCIPLCSGLFFMSKPLTELMCGKNFSPAILIMKVMSLTVLFIPLSNFCLTQIFIPCRKDKYTFIPQIAGTLINSVLNAIFIIKFEALGAGIASVISEAIVCMIAFILAHKTISDLKNIWLFIWQYIIATAVMSLVIFFLLKIITDLNIFLILLIIFIGIISYFLLLLLLRNKYFIDFLKSIKMTYR